MAVSVLDVEVDGHRLAGMVGLVLDECHDPCVLVGLSETGLEEPRLLRTVAGGGCPARGSLRLLRVDDIGVRATARGKKNDREGPENDPSNHPSSQSGHVRLVPGSQD